MTELTVTAADAADQAALLELNEAAMPHVNSISAETLRHLQGQSLALLVARHTDSEQRIAGFLLALHEGSRYESPNFLYFKARYPAFAYVDRIVVAGGDRRRGIGALLYRTLLASLDRPVLTCEVNVRPPNPGSYDFHRRLGFVEVGQQDTEGGRKRVALMSLAREATTQ